MYGYHGRILHIDLADHKNLGRRKTGGLYKLYIVGVWLSPLLGKH